MSNKGRLYLNDNAFTGTVPLFLADISTLTELHLQNNNLRGNLSSNIGNLASLSKFQSNWPFFFDTLILRANIRFCLFLIPICLLGAMFVESLKLYGNQIKWRVPDNVCDLRDRSLEEFVVDCPFRIGNEGFTGVVCGIPTCCTECRPPTAWIQGGFPWHTKFKCCKLEVCSAKVWSFWLMEWSTLLSIVSWKCTQSTWILPKHSLLWGRPPMFVLPDPFAIEVLLS